MSYHAIPSPPGILLPSSLRRPPRERGFLQVARRFDGEHTQKAAAATTTRR